MSSFTFVTNYLLHFNHIRGLLSQTDKSWLQCFFGKGIDRVDNTRVQFSHHYLNTLYPALAQDTLDMPIVVSF